MEKKIFNKITKETFLAYGFSKEKNKYILVLDDITIVVRFCSWRGVKSFNYIFYINELYDSSIDFDDRFDTKIDIKMEHDTSAKGYHRHEILFEEYEEDEYKELLTKMLHSHFDVYKENALQFLRDNEYLMQLTKKARAFLGLNP